MITQDLKCGNAWRLRPGSFFAAFRPEPPAGLRSGVEEKSPIFPNRRFVSERGNSRVFASRFLACSKATSVNRRELAGGKNRAFTLIELLAVIAIVGILAAIVVPVAGRVKDSARDAGCRANIRQMHSAARGYMAETGKVPLRYLAYEMKDGQYVLDSKGNKVKDPVLSDLDPKTDSNNIHRNIYGYLHLTKAQSGTENWFTAATWLANPKAWGPYACPSDAKYHSGAATIEQLRAKFSTGAGVPADSAMNQGSYAYNNRLSHSGLPSGDDKRSMRAVEITRNPILFVDALGSDITPNETNMAAKVRYRHFCGDDYDFQAGTNGLAKGGSCNVVFFDGLVRSFYQDTLPWLGDEKKGIKGDDLWKPF